SGLADGIVITPSHNPPADGGFKYNPVNGGPAGTEITGWVQKQANRYLESKLAGVKRVTFAQACAASTTRTRDYLDAYVSDLINVIDFDAIRGSGLKLAVDPLGGAGVHYWAPIAERYKLDLTVVSEEVDPRFAFMTVDWDGQIRMDPSSEYAMQRLLALKDKYDVAFACDTDHDRHGVVTRSSGLLNANHYLTVMIDYLFRERKRWAQTAAVGKTVVSTALIDRVVRKAGRKLFEVPVGFKWFAPGLFDGSLGFGGEESAGASFLRMDGSVWTTDKDGIVPALLSAEITAKAGRDPGEVYGALAKELGRPFADRVQAAANPSQKQKLSRLSASEIKLDTLGGDKVEAVLDKAPGNDAPIGGVKVVAEHGWFAARPSGTEDIYKIYAESFRDQAHLQSILAEAQQVVDKAIA
ncbi:MAG TPA: alpha-D-glucose phosphate-specific phosphoglucomutase, partial [Rhodanobacteraceae bacterium]|nr:alpha-D-glucose phosphate-specific phosphoglucomutase [Rhodanobacteraceae bacterium]